MRGLSPRAAVIEKEIMKVIGPSRVPERAQDTDIGDLKPLKSRSPTGTHPQSTVESSSRHPVCWLIIKLNVTSTGKPPLPAHLSCPSPYSHLKPLLTWYFLFFLTQGYIFIDLEREEGVGRGERKGGRERQTDRYQCERERSIGCPPYVPNWGLNPQSRYVSWLGIELAMFWCTGQCSNQLSNLAKAWYFLVHLFVSVFFVGFL